MPGEHSEDQKLVGFWCDPEFLKEIDRARGGLPRSQFVRTAVFEKCRELGIEIPEEITRAPDRAGKGGPKPKPVSSAVDAVKQEAAVVALRGVIRKTPKSGR